MPIYEYSCTACGHGLEALQAFSDEPLTACPACGEPRLRKLMSASAFRLKGGGWYETDFKKGNQRNLAGDGKNAEGAGKKEGAGKAEGSGKSEGGKSDKPAAAASDSGSGKSAGDSKKTENS